jgi:hypothetical protein
MLQCSGNQDAPERTRREFSATFIEPPKPPSCGLLSSCLYLAALVMIA